MHYETAGTGAHGDKDPRRQAALAVRAALADTVVFRFLALSYHWNVRGRDFHEMRDFFRRVYEEVDSAVDPMAESVVVLGYEAPKSLHEVLRESRVPQDRVDNDSQDLVAALYRANKAVIESLRRADAAAGTCGDPVAGEVLGLVGGRIEAHAKWGWQMGAMLGQQSEDPYAIDRLPEDAPVVVVAAAPDDCPPATLDVALNLENRKNAIDAAMYGPLNPAEPNDEYWQALADEWSVDADTARRQTCGNCAMFNVSARMKDCISEGVAGDRPDDFDAVDAAGGLGYCEAFDFKCASARTCRAWVGGGPVTAAAEEAADFERGPCWEGYVQIGMKEVDGKQVPNCVPAAEAAGGHQVPEEEEEEAVEATVSFGAEAEAAIAEAVSRHNRTARGDRRASADVARAVYRRGARAFSDAGRTAGTRAEWGSARVDAYLRLLSSGRPQNPAYTADNDLLPASHPLAHEGADPVATALSELSPPAAEASAFPTPEEAILALTELSGFGYDAETALRSGWLRALGDGEDPFPRVLEMAVSGGSGRDSDLLPRNRKG